MELTLLTRLPLLFPPSNSRSLPPSHSAGARRLTFVSSPRGIGFVVLRPRGGGASVCSPFSAAAAAVGDVAEPGSDTILLIVQPEVTSATVDFKEATAIVWTTPEAKVTEDWQKRCGENLASHLGTCGFESHLQG